MIKSYHRPQTLPEALQLLNRPDTLPLAGGTFLNANMPTEVEELVDLQSLDLTQITHVGNTLTLGAMVRLQQLVELHPHPTSPDVREGDILPPMSGVISPLTLLRQTAILEGANTIRNIATMGGVIASGDNESELLAAMLVCATQVTIQNLTESRTVPLSDLLANRATVLKGNLIISITLHLNGQAAHHRVARTPKDKPIVAALARHDGADHWLALCGVAPTPILLTPDQLDNLTPPSDFRGSSEYRHAMARVLVGRVNVSE